MPGVSKYNWRWVQVTSSIPVCLFFFFFLNRAMSHFLGYLKSGPGRCTVFLCVHIQIEPCHCHTCKGRSNSLCQTIQQVVYYLFEHISLVYIVFVIYIHIYILNRCACSVTSAKCLAACRPFKLLTMYPRYKRKPYRRLKCYSPKQGNMEFQVDWHITLYIYIYI